MNFIYPKINFSFEMKTNVLNSIVIEDSSLFEQSVLDLYADLHKSTDNFVFMENDEVISTSKQVSMISSPFDFEYDKRELGKKFISYLVREIDENDMAQKIIDKYAELKEIIDQINFLSEIPVEYNELIVENDIFKHFDIGIKPPEGTFIEKLMEYIKVILKLTEKKIFVLANCEAYINDNEYEYLRKFAECYEIFILFLSNKQLNLIENTNLCIIDVDLCEIH